MGHFSSSNTVLPLSNYFSKCYYWFSHTALFFLLHTIYLLGGRVRVESLLPAHGLQRWTLGHQTWLEALFSCWALSLARSVVFGNTVLINSTKSCLHGLSSCLSNCKLHMLRMKAPILSLPITSLVIHVNFVLNVPAKNLSINFCISFSCTP